MRTYWEGRMKTDPRQNKIKAARRCERLSQCCCCPYCLSAPLNLVRWHTSHPLLILAAGDRQLLWRELWLGAGGAADWWARQRSFAASAAAMSMVSLF